MGLCSLLFPKLFPNGQGDPTSKARMIDVSESLAVKHLMKISVIDSKGNRYYPYAQHTRFKFWFYEGLRRHRVLDQ